MSKRVWPPPLIQKSEFHHTNDWYLFNKWYAENIESLGEGVEVLIEMNSAGQIVNQDHAQLIQFTHRALAIRIEPLKEETAEDILRKLVSEVEDRQIRKMLDEARKFLERKERK